MIQVTLEEAESKLGDLIENARRGEEIIILRNNIAIARLQPVAFNVEPREPVGMTTKTDFSGEDKKMGQRSALYSPREPGSARGIIRYMAEDFNAPLEEFEEYM